MDTREEVREVFVGMTNELRRLLALRVAVTLGGGATAPAVKQETERIWRQIDHEVLVIVGNAVEETNKLITPQLPDTK